MDTRFRVVDARRRGKFDISTVVALLVVVVDILATLALAFASHSGSARSSVAPLTDWTLTHLLDLIGEVSKRGADIYNTLPKCLRL